MQTANDKIYKGKYPKGTYLFSKDKMTIIKVVHYETFDNGCKKCMVYHITLSYSNFRGLCMDSVNRYISEEYIIHNDFVPISKEKVDKYIEEVKTFGYNLFKK